MNAYQKLTKADFYDFLRNQSEGRFEFVRGRIMQQMTGGTRRHGITAKRFETWFDRNLDQTIWLALQARGVETSETVRFPDVVVEPAEGDADDSMAASGPVIAVEVLSKSSEQRDFHEKPSEYMSLPTLIAYIVASQGEPKCWVWQRGVDGTFPDDPVEIAGIGASIDLPALNVRIPLAEIYR